MFVQPEIKKRRLLLTYMIPSTHEMHSKFSVVTVEENDKL